MSSTAATSRTKPTLEYCGRRSARKRRVRAKLHASAKSSRESNVAYTCVPTSPDISARCHETGFHGFRKSIGMPDLCVIRSRKVTFPYSGASAYPEYRVTGASRSMAPFAARRSSASVTNSFVREAIL